MFMSFAESRFEKNCLTEYAEVFKTVYVDAAYYVVSDLELGEAHKHWAGE